MSELSLSPVPTAQSESELPLTTSKKGRRTRRFGVEQHSRPPMARMLRIHDLISRNEHPNCTSMAAEFEVSCKTVMRDIDFMRDQLQLPIAYNALHRGFCYTKPVSAFPRMTITEGEIVAQAEEELPLAQVIVGVARVGGWVGGDPGHR